MVPVIAPVTAVWACKSPALIVKRTAIRTARRHPAEFIVVSLKRMFVRLGFRKCALRGEALWNVESDSERFLSLP
jgi:hypothetical protein